MVYLIPKTCRIKDIFESAKDIRTFVLECADFGSAPGQIANLWIPNVDEKPFGVAKDTGTEVWLTISKVGPFTEEVFKLKKDDQVGLRGPFGKGFTLMQNAKVAIVGGGFGTAPLHYLGEAQKKNDCQVWALIGARSKDLLVWVDECQKSGFETIVSTNDGSAGHQGFITEPLAELLDKEDINLVQTCGPEVMMKAVAELCQKKGVKCELSAERYMKCGFGICGQCVLNGKRMCQEGPVVSAEFALQEGTEFGKFHRGPEGQKEYY